MADIFDTDTYELLLLLAGTVARSTILLAAAWVATRLLRRASAAVRHRIWAFSLCGLIALPTVSQFAPAWPLPVLPARSPADAASMVGVQSHSEHIAATPSREARAARVESGAFIREEPLPRHDVSVAPSSPLLPVMPRQERVSTTVPPVPRFWTQTEIGLAVWFAGFLAFLTPTLAGLVANELRRVFSQRIVTGDWMTLAETLRRQLLVHRSVELRQSSGSLIPMTWGIFRPVILLPEGSHAWPEARRRAVLLHELAHVERLDTLFQLAGRLAAALYWFHPLAWHALRQMRIECEHACDDRVVDAGERATDYAKQLLDLARTLRMPRWSVAMAMSRRSTLEERMIALFDENRCHQPLNRATGRRLLILSCAAVLGIALIQPRPRAVAEPPQTASPAVAIVNPAAGAQPDEATGRIRGQVVLDSGGTAAPGAEVLLLFPYPKGQDYYTVKYPIRRATADARGTFTFERLPPGKYRVWANLGELTSRRTRSEGAAVVLTNPGEAAKPLELRLVSGIALSVVVKDQATNRPIPDATVHITWSDYDADPHTDRDGRTVLQPMRAEEWAVEAWADGFARESQSINLKNGGDAAIEFLLRPGGDLEGVVRDPTGKPLAGTRISASVAARYRQIAYIESDAQGRYRLPNLPRNVDLQLNMSKEGYMSKEVSARVGGASGLLGLTLEPRPDGGSIVGTVLDHKGQPISGAELINTGNSSVDTREAKTGPDGRFRLDNLYIERNFGTEVLVRAPRAAPKRLKVETGPRDKPAEVTIHLDAGHRILGRVVDEKGNALEGVRVYFAHANRGFSDGGRGETNKDGGFGFDALPPGCPFSFVKQGFSEVEDRSLPLDTGEVITVTMKPSGVILGKVVDAKTGRAIPACNVRVTFSPTRRSDEPSVGLLASLSDPGQNFQSGEGLFRLADLVVGMPLQVTVSARGYETSVVERVVVARPDEARSDEYRLIPVDPASLRSYRVRLLDTHGKPIAGAQLRLIAATDRTPANSIGYPFNWSMIESGQIAQQSKVTRFLEAVSDGQGRFEFTSVPRKDQVELVWWGKGVAPGRRGRLEKVRDDESIDVTTPEPARITCTIDRQAYGDNISVQVSHPDMSLPDATVKLKPGETTVDVADLAPIEYQVSVMGPPERVDNSGGFTIRPLASETVSLKPGEIRRIRFGK